jgi:hypothetical protein
MRLAGLIAALGALAWLLAQPAWAQAVGQTALPDIESIQKRFGRATCPGDPPGNLGSLNCEFTKTMRLQKFIGGSVTDQALLSASFFGTVAHFRDQPPEWGGGWEGLGKRIGTRYGQGVAKGLAVFGVGLLVRDDPRLVDYASDPLIDKKQRERVPTLARERRGRAWTRIGHAFMDFATVRKSAPMGDGGRQPDWPLFAGAVVSGYAGNLWAPERLTTPEETAKRIGGSLGTALFASFYNEFSPEVGRLLGRLFRRGATSQTSATPASQP